VTRPLSHDEAWPELPAAALDALPAAEQAAVLEHAATCPQCAPELAAYGETAALLGHAAAPAALDAERGARLRARLLARAAADGAGGASATGAPARRADQATATAAPPVPGTTTGAAERARARWGMGSRLAPWVAVAASVAFIAAAAGLARVTRERDELRLAARELQARRAAAAARADSLDSSLREREQMLAALTGPAVRVVDLAAAGRREPTARMFWDRATNRWTMFAHDLAQPGAGKTYQLWLVTADDRKISAGTFEPSASGDVVMQATYALEPSALRAIAVTEEPAGGVPQPTGPVVIVGELRG
jgi:hypothetical protein